MIVQSHWTVATISVLVAAVAATQVLDVLDEAAVAVLELPLWPQQIALFGLVFGIFFGSLVLVTGSLLDGFFVLTTTNKTNETNKTMEYPLVAVANAQTDKEKFLCLFEPLKEEILETLCHNNDILEEARNWLDDMIQYSVPGGKLNRGTTVVDVYRTLLKRQTLTDLQVCQASVLGWVIEFLQAFFLVADDVMDGSQTRRGAPCWYKQSHVGLIAINDSFLLESFCFTILKNHFGTCDCYMDLVQLLLDVTQKTEIGQLYDLTSQVDGQMDLDRFTMERYEKIVQYKTAYYSFYLPVAMGMILSGMRDKGAFALAEKICLQMGEYFQIQDDYLDCYGDPSVIGKVGTDIQDNKCSWLVVQALQKCGPGQRKVLEKNYGQWDDKKVKAVKKLYGDLQLEQLFQEYEEQSYASIQEDLKEVKLMPKKVFEIFLAKIYKRSK